MKKVIILPPYNEWSKEFKKIFFSRLGNFNSIKNEEDMFFAKEIRLIYRNKMFMIEVDWHTDIIELLKSDIPPHLLRQLRQLRKIKK